jgi:hypothetical protein
VDQSRRSAMMLDPLSPMSLAPRQSSHSVAFFPQNMSMPHNMSGSSFEYVQADTTITIVPRDTPTAVIRTISVSAQFCSSQSNSNSQSPASKRQRTSGPSSPLTRRENRTRSSDWTAPFTALLKEDVLEMVSSTVLDVTTLNSLDIGSSATFSGDAIQPAPLTNGDVMNGLLKYQSCDISDRVIDGAYQVFEKKFFKRSTGWWKWWSPLELRDSTLAMNSVTTLKQRVKLCRQLRVATNDFHNTMSKSVNTIFVPLLLKSSIKEVGNHWVLVVFRYFETITCDVYDSATYGSGFYLNHPTFKECYSYMTALIKSFYPTADTVQPNFPMCPLQAGRDCGLHVILNSLFLIQNPTHTGEIATHAGLFPTSLNYIQWRYTVAAWIKTGIFHVHAVPVERPEGPGAWERGLQIGAPVNDLPELVDIQEHPSHSNMVTSMCFDFGQAHPFGILGIVNPVAHLSQIKCTLNTRCSLIHHMLGMESAFCTDFCMDRTAVSLTAKQDQQGRVLADALLQMMSKRPKDSLPASNMLRYICAPILVCEDYWSLLVIDFSTRALELVRVCEEPAQLSDAFLLNFLRLVKSSLFSHGIAHCLLTGEDTIVDTLPCWFGSTRGIGSGNPDESASWCVKTIELISDQIQQHSILDWKQIACCLKSKSATLNLEVPSSPRPEPSSPRLDALVDVAAADTVMLPLFITVPSSTETIAAAATLNQLSDRHAVEQVKPSQVKRAKKPVPTNHHNIVYTCNDTSSEDEAPAPVKRAKKPVPTNHHNITYTCNDTSSEDEAPVVRAKQFQFKKTTTAAKKTHTQASRKAVVLKRAAALKKTAASKKVATSHPPQDDWIYRGHRTLTPDFFLSTRRTDKTVLVMAADDVEPDISFGNCPEQTGELWLIAMDWGTASAMHWVVFGRTSDGRWEYYDPMAREKDGSVKFGASYAMGRLNEYSGAENLVMAEHDELGSCVSEKMDESDCCDLSLKECLSFINKIM